MVEKPLQGGDTKEGVMKKTLILVLFPVVLLVAGALAVWGDEQAAVQPGCNKCAKMAQPQQTPCANCPKAAAEQGAAPCANCPNAANMEKGMPCPNCPKQGADAKPAGCSKCAKLQQPDPQPAAQPVQKGCCNKQKVL